MGEIRVITEPTVRLVGRQVIDEEALSAFLKDEDAECWTTDTDIAAQKLTEVAGRLCYKSYAKPRPGGNQGYIGHILEVGHGSVIEHAVYNFIITGVSRSLTHEWVRHRAGWAYSQRSQRFCDESELSAVVPPLLIEEVEEARRFIARFGDPHPTAVDVMNYVVRHTDVEGYAEPSLSAAVGLQWLSHMEMFRLAYSGMSDYLSAKLIRGHFPQDGVDTKDAAIGWMARHKDQATGFRKQAREAARSVLPNAAETQIFVTANARALRHFIEARGDASADAEIRRLAIAMCRLMQSESPNLFGDYEIHPTEGGSEYITTKWKKV